MSGRTTLAVAHLAGMIDDGTLSLAIRAGCRRLNIAKNGALVCCYITRSMAMVALLLLGALGQAGAIAVLARSQAIVTDGLGATSRRLFKRDGRLMAMSRPWRRAWRLRADPPERPPPKKDEKMSSTPIPPKMSEMST